MYRRCLEMADDDRELLVPVELNEMDNEEEKKQEIRGEKKVEEEEEMGKMYEVDLGDNDSEHKSSCCEEGGGACCHSNNHRPLSVQSGDIVRPSTPSLPPSHSLAYRKLFPYVHKVVSKVFVFERYSAVPCGILAFLVLVTAVMAYLVLGGIYPLTYNISIESVQVPDHESSIHWDAYQAALQQQIYNETNPNTLHGGSSATSKNYGGGGGGGGGNEQKAVSSPSSCCANGYSHQRTMHGTWVLELVYRGRGGKNLLETRHIEYLHSIEEHIYNLPKYKTVCHFAFYNQVCDPINSLLTYLYPRSKEDGSLERDTLPDNWENSIDYSKLSVQEAEQLLWYTGGNIGNTSLLRAQVSVGFCNISHSIKWWGKESRFGRLF